MAWGSIRQHSIGATWEHSPSAIHDDRILGFLSTFGLNKRHSDGRRKEPKKQPRGGHQPSAPEPSYNVLQRTRPTTKAPTSTLPASLTSRPPLRPMYDDPAFSADPRSHPHFYDQTRNHTVKPQSSLSSSGSQWGRPAGQTPHRREPAIYHLACSDLSDETDDSTFALLAPPLGQPYLGPPQSSHSSESANTNSTTTTTVSISHVTPPSSNYSPPSSNDHSLPVKQSTSGPVNRAMDPAESNSTQRNPPPPYEESIIFEPEPETNVHQQRPPAPRGISAPELHQTPEIPAPPPRPLTAPNHDADNRPIPTQKREPTGGGGSRQAHNPQRTRELDRIDELDETDPFGGAMHHRGPYEAINAILGGTANADRSGSGEQRPGLPKPTRSKRSVYQIRFPDGPTVADPYAPLHLEPGQILARPPIFDQRNLDQTPYHRQHHSISNPYPPLYQHAQAPGIAVPRRHSERQPPHPRYFPQQQQQPLVVPPPGHHHSSGMPVLQVDRYTRPHPPPQPQNYPQPQIYLQPPQQLAPQSESRHQLPRSQSQHQSELLDPSQHRPPSQNYPQSPPENYLQPQSESRHHSRHQSDPQHHSQLQPPPHTVRVESWSPNHLLPEIPNPKPSSRYDNQQGPVPLHIPKRLVMPSPLHQPNAPLPPHPYHPDLPDPQRHYPSRQLRPTPSQTQFHDPSFVPPTAIPRSKSHRAEDISMLPDGRKLQRKRTSTVPPNSILANEPIPMHVPLSEMSTPDHIPHMPSQDRLSPHGQEMKGREKAGRRLSKRRNDI